MAGDSDSNRNDSQWRSEVTHIITNFMRQRLSKRGLQWSSPAASAVRPELLPAIQSLNLIADSMLAQNEVSIREMSTRAVNQNILDYQSFEVIANEMFVNGCQWSHIVMLLLFASELAFTLAVSASPQEQDSQVSQVNDWLIRYFSGNQSVKQWVTSQGRWSGLAEYAALPDRRGVPTGLMLLVAGSVATVTLATVIHYFVKA